jgi:hypothetical protein
MLVAGEEAVLIRDSLYRDLVLKGGSTLFLNGFRLYTGGRADVGDGTMATADCGPLQFGGEPVRGRWTPTEQYRQFDNVQHRGEFEIYKATEHVIPGQPPDLAPWAWERVNLVCRIPPPRVLPGHGEERQFARIAFLCLRGGASRFHRLRTRWPEHARLLLLLAELGAAFGEVALLGPAGPALRLYVDPLQTHLVDRNVVLIVLRSCL